MKILDAIILHQHILMSEEKKNRGKKYIQNKRNSSQNAIIHLKQGIRKTTRRCKGKKNSNITANRVCNLFDMPSPSLHAASVFKANRICNLFNIYAPSRRLPRRIDYAIYSTLVRNVALGEPVCNSGDILRVT